MRARTGPELKATYRGAWLKTGRRSWCPAPEEARDPPAEYSRFDLSSPDGERGAQPPRREGRRLPAPLRHVRNSGVSSTALLEADSFEDLPGKWQAAIVKSEQNRPNLRLISSD
jgi:hypothetical protein